MSTATETREYFVNFIHPDCADDPSWCISCIYNGEPMYTLFGFGRKRDAEIALMAMLEIAEIDWNASQEEITEAFRNYGGRKRVMKFVCERLQW